MGQLRCSLLRAKKKKDAVGGAPADCQKIKRVKMSNFDERSGMVYCKTSWGQWGQTIEEVFIEVDVTEGTKARDIRCDIKPKAISVTISNKLLIQVLLYNFFFKMMYSNFFCGVGKFFRNCTGG